MDLTAVDLTKYEGTLSNYLAKELPKIDKMTPEQMYSMLETAIKNTKTSPQKGKQVLDAAKRYMNNKRRLMKYIADIILKGAGAGVIKGSRELLTKLAEIYGRDELIVRTALCGVHYQRGPYVHEWARGRNFDPAEGARGFMIVEDEELQVGHPADPGRETLTDPQLNS